MCCCPHVQLLDISLNIKDNEQKSHGYFVSKICNPNLTYPKENVLQYPCNFLFPDAVEKTSTTEVSENAGMY